MELTSIEYAKLIAWLAFKNDRITLGRTQIQKILFVCYGLFYATKGRLMFDDDTAKAWPFGPVFPRSYKRYNYYIDSELSEEEKKSFAEDVETLKMITTVTHKLSYYSARDLTAWSHQPGTPWAKVILDQKDIKWNTELNKDDIRAYFSSGDWKRGL